MRRLLPNYNTIRQYLDIVDGDFVWKIHRNSIVRAGMKAGSIVKGKRTSVLIIDNVTYSSANIAYKFWYGKDPKDRVIFVDGDRLNFCERNIVRQRNDKM